MSRMNSSFFVISVCNNPIWRLLRQTKWDTTYFHTAIYQRWNVYVCIGVQIAKIIYNVAVCITHKKWITNFQFCAIERTSVKVYRDVADKWKFIDTRVQLTWASSNAFARVTKPTICKACIESMSALLRIFFQNHSAFIWKIAQSFQFNRDNVETF